MANHRAPLLVRLRQFIGSLGDRLSRLGAALVWPIEAVIGFVSRRLLAVSEHGERFESGLVALVRAISWPIRALWRAFRALAGVIVPTSVRRWLAVPLQALGSLLRRLAAGTNWLVESLNLDGLALWLVWLLRPVWYPLAAIGNVLLVFCATRRYRQLLFGLPALLLLLPVLAAVAWGMYAGQSSVATHYRLAVRDAIKEQDFTRAVFYERRLAQLGADTRMSDYRTAEALAQKGKIKEAYARMQLLTPPDEPGFPPAHIWIIQRLLVGELDVPADESERLFGYHLDQLTAQGIKAPELDLLRALWLAQRGNLREAADLLQPLIYRLPLAAMERLRIDLELGRRDEARTDALAVRQHMESLLRQGTVLNTAHYQCWSLAEELLGNNTRIRQVLEEWLAKEPDNEDVRRNLAAVSLREFNVMVNMPYPDAVELAARIREAFELSEVTVELKQQLVGIYRRKASRAALEEAFNRLAESPQLPSALAETLGTAAALDGEWDRAHNLLRRAVEDDPDNDVAWNNLACVLYQRPQPRLQEALAAANRALEHTPDEFRFRETRGQIFLKLSRWQEAVDDLEFALNGMPNVPAIHQALATAYEALGDEQLASVHRQTAE